MNDMDTFEYSLLSARTCGDSAADKRYLDWFLKESISRVSRATITLARLADGGQEFNAATIGTIRASIATVAFIEQGLSDLREHFSRVTNRMELVQDAMSLIAVDVDSARESYQTLARLFDAPFAD